MKSVEFIAEAVGTERLDIEIQPTTGTRVFFEGFLKPEADETPNWLRVVTKKKLVVEATVEIRNSDECYVGHIQAHRENKGFGSELLNYIIKYYNSKGIHKFSAYINHDNINSRSMFRKAGFTESQRKQHGSYWALQTQ